MDSNEICGNSFINVSGFCPSFLGWSDMYATPDYNYPNIAPPQAGFNFIQSAISEDYISGESVMTQAQISPTRYLVSFYLRSRGFLNNSVPLNVQVGFTNSINISDFEDNIDFLQNASYQTIYTQSDISSSWEKVVLCVEADNSYNSLYFIPSIDGSIMSNCIENEDLNCAERLYLSRVDAIRDIFPQGGTRLFDCDSTNTALLGDTTLCQEMDGLQYYWETTSDVVLDSIANQFVVDSLAVWDTLYLADSLILDTIPNTNPVVVDTTYIPVSNPFFYAAPPINTAYRLNRTFGIADSLNIPLTMIDGANGNCTVERSVEFIVVVPEVCCPDQSTVDMSFNLSEGQQLCFSTNDLPVTLSPNDTFGGIFSGEGVTGNTFNPSSTGTYTITYTVTDIPQGCDYMESVEVEVIDSPNADFVATSLQTCNQFVYLTPLTTGGIWSGIGVTTNGIFNPINLNPGDYMVTYTIDNGICAAVSSSQILTVLATPDASFNVNNPLATTYCSNDDRVALIPVTSGGTFLVVGDGLVEENGQWFFDPALVDPVWWGTEITIRHVINEGQACFVFESAVVTVVPAPDAAFTGLNESQFYCSDEGNVALNGVGTFIGNGVSGNTFSPTLAGTGTHIITHTVVDANSGCQSEEAVEVIVGNCCVPTIDVENREQLDCCLDDENTNDNLIDLTDTAEGVFAQGGNFRYVVQGTFGGFPENWTNNSNELETVFGNFTSAVKLNVDLVIPNGVDVIISNMELQFGPEGRIIVERGGVLTLTDGAELSGLCNSMWQGIQVHGPGYYNDYSYDGNTSNLLNSGKLNFARSSENAPDVIIEDAIIGVVNRKVALFNMDNLPNQMAYLGDLIAVGEIDQVPTKLLPNLTDTEFSGGVVELGDGLIQDCFYGVAISGYGGDTEFIADNTRFIGQPSTNVNHLKYPLQDFDSEIGIMLRFTPFDNHTIQNECMFVSLTHGIYSEMSGIKTIDDVYFNNCVRGITEANFLDNQLITIEKCNFHNCLIGIQATGGELLIEGNLIGKGNLVFDEGIGMLLRGCDFTVQNYNYITMLHYGMVILDSYQTENMVKRNYFWDAYVNVLNGGINAQVEFRCNNFDDYIENAIRVMPWEGVNEGCWLGDQGNCQTSEEPAANTFTTQSTTLLDGKDIWAHPGSEEFDYSDVPAVLATIEATNDIVTEVDCNLSGYDEVTYCNSVKILTIPEIQALPTEELKNKELAKLYFSYKSNNQEANAINALEQINTPYAQRKLVPYKIQNREFSLAQQLLDGLATISLEEQHFVTYHKILLNLAQSSRKPSDLNVFEKALLFDMAQHRTKTAYKAQTLLHVARGMYFPVEIPEFVPPNNGGGHKQSFETKSESLVSLIHPNPISSISYLKHNLGKSETAQLHIFNLQGRKVHSKILKGKGSTMIEAKNFESGMYLYVVEQKGTILLKEKLFVVK